LQFLTAEECRLWLEPSGIEIDEYGRPAESYTPPRNVFALPDPKLSSPYVVRAAMDWLPVGRERLVFVSATITYPPDLMIVFEAIRRGCGASSEVVATPGHLFVSTKTEDTDYDDRPAVDVFEESIAMWIGGLALEWTWPGLIAVKACAEFIELGDGYMRFVSPSASRLEQAVGLSAQLGLRTLDRFPWS
jgi:hypothetical protein